MQQNKLDAFTVLETVITLAISCMLIFIGSLKMESYENQLVLVNTEKQVKTAIEQAARVAIVKHDQITVMYMESSSFLSFKSSKCNRRLKIDKRVKLSSPINFQISNKGSLSPRTINIYNKKDSKKLKLQMMWGRAIDE